MSKDNKGLLDIEPLTIAGFEIVKLLQLAQGKEPKFVNYKDFKINVLEEELKRLQVENYKLKRLKEDCDVS